MTMPAVVGRAISLALTNQTGATVAKGAAVIDDVANDASFLTTVTVADRRVMGLAGQDFAIGEKGRVIVGGVGEALVQGLVVRGHYLRTSATAGRLEDTGTAVGAAVDAPAGSCAIALEGGTTTLLLVSFAIYGHTGGVGPAGAAGAAGPQGPIGTPGAEGADGQDGNPGPPGPAGPQGATGAGGGGGGGEVADIPPTAPNAMDDEFNDLTTGGVVMSGPINGLQARWVWANQGPATATFGIKDHLDLFIGAPQAADSFRMIVQAIPAAQDWTMTAKIALGAIDGGRARAGLILAAAGATPALLDWSVVVDATNPKLQGLQWNWPGAFVGGVAGGDAPSGNTMYLRITHIQATGHYQYWYSQDGLAWIREADFADPITVTRVGLYVNEHDNGGISHCIVDWFRRTA